MARSGSILGAIIVAVAVLAFAAIRPAAEAATAPKAKAPAAARTVPFTATEDVVLGRANAPVTVVEYASVACPHCADFHTEVMPAFKAKYIDTGKVRFIAREAITGDPNLAVAGFLLARCAGKTRYFAVTDAIYRKQGEIYAGGNLRTGLLPIAASVGMTEAQFDACLSSEANVAALKARLEAGAKQYPYNSTPTFYVNGKKISAPGADGGGLTLAQLDAAIAAARAPAR